MGSVCIQVRFSGKVLTTFHTAVSFSIHTYALVLIQCVLTGIALAAFLTTESFSIHTYTFVCIQVTFVGVAFTTFLTGKSFSLIDTFTHMHCAVSLLLVTCTDTVFGNILENM